ncbi:MAG: outer membrane lipoprotein-sorting protein [Bacteroidales bacterium]|nr:outer membrane lipoprotein-sorting protein [Bacteroidales bacterium]
MKTISITTITLILLGFGTTFAQTAEQILNEIDDNMSSENQVAKTTMIIHGRRNSRTLTAIGYSVGDKKSFTEYLSPAREQGTKMLKLENQLWIYSPSTDRTIQISGHMLRQSVMGSDLSYEDVMDDRKLTEMYNAEIIGEEEIDGTKTKVLELTAKVEDVAYHSRKIWVDTEKYVPLKEELFAKSGQLLKQTTLSDVKKIEGRWFPTRMIYKDMLKQGDGTEFIVDEIKFNQDIPEYIFTKAALKK